MSDVYWFRKLMVNVGENIVGVCVGGEIEAPYYFLAGAKAFTTGIINIVPKLSKDIYSAIIGKKWERVFSIQDRIRPLNKIRNEPGKMVHVIKEVL